MCFLSNSDILDFEEYAQLTFYKLVYYMKYGTFFKSNKHVHFAVNYGITFGYLVTVQRRKQVYVIV